MISALGLALAAAWGAAASPDRGFAKTLALGRAEIARSAPSPERLGQSLSRAGREADFSWPAVREAMRRIASVLTPDLLKSSWRRPGASPLAGHCYAASEALYHLLGGKAAGWTPMVLRHEGGTHWFLRHSSGLAADITAAQFKTPVPYGEARGTGFLTRMASRRARIIMERAESSPPPPPGTYRVLLKRGVASVEP